jgi:ectoine hydroxylase-related dioxygenase (phytanoyl-CoA dioxygenase family)
LASAAARAVVDDGWTILEGVIPADQVAQLAERIDAVNDALGTPFGGNEFLGTRTRRLFNLLPRDDAFADVPLAAPVLSVVDGVIGDDCLLSSLTAVEMNPGETAQPFHADDGSLPLPRPHAPLTCTAIWALTDFTIENGATRLVPGSHDSERIPRRGETPAFVQAEMSAGSVLVYHGSLWHGGAANQSDGRRLGIIVNYCAGFLRQEECQLLAVSRDQAAAFPPRLQALVGYSTYRGLLGHVDQKSPQTLLDPDAPSDMVWERMRSR